MTFYDIANKIEDIEQSIQELFGGFPTEPIPEHEYPSQYKITVTVERVDRLPNKIIYNTFGEVIGEKEIK